MARPDVVVAEVRRLFGDSLDELAERLSDIDEADTPDFSGLDPSRRDEVLRDGTAGLWKLTEYRADELTEAEVTGLEAIILLEGRPALFIQGGDFYGVPPLWQVLNQHRDGIKGSIARVGRVEVAGLNGRDWSAPASSPDLRRSSRTGTLPRCSSAMVRTDGGLSPARLRLLTSTASMARSSHCRSR